MDPYPNLQHGHRRVIVAVPFLTITEQTAAVYRDIFESDNREDDVVLEHHSGAYAADEEDFHTGPVWSRLAAENWDAPIVVTNPRHVHQQGRAPGRTPSG